MPTTVIVSADIQPRARERVLAMGAKAIVKKPATAVDVDNALRECGARP